MEIIHTYISILLQFITNNGLLELVIKFLVSCLVGVFIGRIILWKTWKLKKHTSTND